MKFCSLVNANLKQIDRLDSFFINACNTWNKKKIENLKKKNENAFFRFMNLRPYINMYVFFRIYYSVPSSKQHFVGQLVF